MKDKDLDKLNELRDKFYQTKCITVTSSGDFTDIMGYVKIGDLTNQQVKRFEEQVKKMVSEEQAAALAAYETELSKWGQQK